MGDKVIAKQLADECGLPLVPGTEDSTDSLEEAQALPRSSACHHAQGCLRRWWPRHARGAHHEQSPRRSSRLLRALAAFGNGKMFLERYVEAPRHIEVQILADGEGNVVHLAGAASVCSAATRRLWARSPATSTPIFASAYDDAVKLAKHINYRNAGTVEFMVDKEGATISLR